MGALFLCTISVAVTSLPSKQMLWVRVPYAAPFVLEVRDINQQTYGEENHSTTRNRFALTSDYLKQ